MRRARKTAAPAETRRGSRKLFRVLVVGGAVLAASCATAPRSGKDPAPAGTDDKATSQGAPAPGSQPGGGVSGW